MRAGCAIAVVLDLLVLAILWQDARTAALLVLATLAAVAILWHMSSSDYPIR